MSIGSIGRRMLGPFEHRVSQWVKAVFLNTDKLSQAIVAAGAQGRILEVGCGDGILAEALMRQLPPTSEFLGIDISENPGHLFGGDRTRASFQNITVAELAASAPEPFDVVAIIDVLHHVPDAELKSLVDDAFSLLREGGLFVIVEWERRKTPGFWAGWFSDRCISGQQVRFFTADELLNRVTAQMAIGSLVTRQRIGPIKSNLLLAWPKLARQPVQM